MVNSTTRKAKPPGSNWQSLKKTLHDATSKRSKSSRSGSIQTALQEAAVSRPSDHAEIHVPSMPSYVKNSDVVALRQMITLPVPPPTASTSPQTSTVGKYIAIDCEMVGVGPLTPSTRDPEQLEAVESSLARVSLVDFQGTVLLDVFVKQKERVTDYRTAVSGVRAENLVGDRAIPFDDVQKMVAAILKGKMLVGHAVHNDLKALLLSHSSSHTFDTQAAPVIRTVYKTKRAGLKHVIKQEFGLDIQGGEHSSVIDARATMALFRLYKAYWTSRTIPPFVLERQGSKTVSATGSKLQSAVFTSSKLAPQAPSITTKDTTTSLIRSSSPFTSSVPDYSQSESPARTPSPTPSISLQRLPQASTSNSATVVVDETVGKKRKRRVGDDPKPVSRTGKAAILDGNDDDDFVKTTKRSQGKGKGKSINPPFALSLAGPSADSMKGKTKRPETEGADAELLDQLAEAALKMDVASSTASSHSASRKDPKSSSETSTKPAPKKRKLSTVRDSVKSTVLGSKKGSSGDGGGRKGLSSGLSTVVRGKDGSRTVFNKSRVQSTGGPGGARGGGPSGSNWWSAL